MGAARAGVYQLTGEYETRYKSQARNCSVTNAQLTFSSRFAVRLRNDSKGGAADQHMINLLKACSVGQEETWKEIYKGVWLLPGIVLYLHLTKIS
ncbi:hypothetical protein C7T94_07390 [Pedobacter yulinensis]|uniref:Uncharacterized protein n=1 Tax=Pedobacter yulinensis TaxID=2126353 RepID=A0A2T3HJC3_9SPHI|nr:hypothetical protein C7T94_07390 [Pedobacter yulinensis]